MYTSKNITDAVSLALDAAKGRNVVLFGANVAQQCLGEHLVDELLIHIVPVLLGEGIRRIENHSVQKTNMETISVGRSGQIIDMRYRVLK